MRAVAARFPVAIFVFAFLGWTFDFYDLVLLGFLKDAVGRDLHMSHAHRGLAAGRRAWARRASAGWSRARWPIGSGSGACSRRPCWSTRSARSSAALAPTPAGRSSLGRIVQGLGIGGEWAIGHGMLAEAVPPAIRGRAAAALQAGEPFGVSIAAIVGYLVLPRVGWRAVLIGSSVTALLAVAVRASVASARPARARAAPCRAELRAAAPRSPGCAGRFVRRLAARACSSSARTGAATPGCRVPRRSRCTRASGARSPG